MIHVLIKRGWLLALILHGLFVLFIGLFVLGGIQETGSHRDAYCTFYCEEYGCTHGNRFARFYPLVTVQVKGLYAVTEGITGVPFDWHGYQLVNLAVYCVFYGGLVLWLPSYLFGGHLSRTSRPAWGHWVGSLLAAGSLGLWVRPDTGKVLFESMVRSFLWLGKATGYSLYEVYTLGFVFVGPAFLIVLILMAGIKRAMYRKKGSASVTVSAL